MQLEMQCHFHLTSAGKQWLRPLLKVFNLDKLNYNNDPQTGGDGFFDFVQGITVDSQNENFTTKEPFGELF
jgi:cell surface protein SprA